MYYPDLSDYTYYLKKPTSTVKNVGWLDKDHPFSMGEVSPEFVEKLRAVILGRKNLDVHVNKVRCIHPCNLCGTERIALMDADRKVLLGMSEIWIPGNETGSFFAAPSMVLHYIEQHGYKPPKAFLDAVAALDLDDEFNAQKTYENLMARLGQ